MNKIILIGGGGHCKSVIDVIEQEARFQIAGIVDKPELLGTKVLGYPVIGNDFDLEILAKKYHYSLITVGQIKSSLLRIKLFDLAYKAGFTLPSIISPRAYVSKHSKIGQGTIIMHHAIVNSNAKIRDNCIVNSKALIEHDVVIGNHCHISTGTIINGNCKIKDEVFIGSGTICKHGITIGQKVIVNAGKYVDSNISSNSFLK